MKYLRRVAKKTRRDHERNSKIREELGVRQITTELEEKQLNWYGHMKRMEKERLPRKIWEARTEGKRGRGRPRTTWLQSITNAGKTRNKTRKEMDRIVGNRKEWRSFAERNPTPLGTKGTLRRRSNLFGSIFWKPNVMF